MARVDAKNRCVWVGMAGIYDASLCKPGTLFAATKKGAEIARENRGLITRREYNPFHVRWLLFSEPVAISIALVY